MTSSADSEPALLQRLRHGDDPADWAALGRLRMAREAFAEAVACFDAVLRQLPAHVPSRLNRAICWLQLGESQRAAEEAAMLHRVLPEHPTPLRLLAEAALASGDPTAAEQAAREGLRIDARDAALWHALASALDDQRRFPEALAAGEAALRLTPDSLPTLSLVQFLRRRLCRFDDLAQGNRALRSALAAGEAGASPFAFLAEEATPAEQTRCAALAAATLEKLPPVLRHPRAAGTPIRVGFVSNGFGQHPTALLIVAMLEHLADSAPDIQWLGYALNPDDGSTLRRRLTQALDALVDVHATSTAAIAQRIADDRIDVLIDLRGWGGGGRPGIFARRPAPVQVNWLAYPGSSGAPWMDVLLADRFVIPESQQPHYRERVVYLPHAFQPSDTTRVIGPAPTRAACGLPDNGFVLASFNNSYKISPAVFARWLHLLQSHPGSVLWLLIAEGTADVASRLRAEAGRAGVDPDRLVFMPKLAHDDYLRRFALVDLFLDTAPYGAHTTASDALWAGCPVLTRPGDTFASRVAGSLLHTLGLPELIAEDDADYLARATHWMHDPASLREIRRKLEQARANSACFDMRRFAIDFATVIRSLAAPLLTATGSAAASSD